MPNDNEIDVALGEILAKIRLDKDLSQEALAEAAGLHRTYVSQLERGLKSPTVRCLFAIAEALDTTPEEVLGEVQRMLM